MGQKYVVGFAFDENRSFVALIRKNRPKWQEGRLNGIGGKVENGETYAEAMVREFEEEAGYQHENWTEAFDLIGPDWHVMVYYADGVPVDDLESKTDEIVEVHPVDDLPSDTIYNLQWMIPMLLDNDVKKPVVIPYFR